MCPLVSIPQDILIIILLLLSLKDISTFRRTCRAACRLVTGSKQLWAHILREEVVAKKLRLPFYRAAFEEVEAVHLESWTRCALMIHRNYNDSAETEVSRMEGLGCITWIRLVRGRWCFIACSDMNQSRLLLLDSIRDLECKAQLYFPGPIMDGQICESDSGIDIAVTIGTRIPFIEVLKFGVQRNQLSLQKLASIPQASFTRLIKGTLVGFAVRYDDDSYPHIFNWRTGRTWILKTEDSGSSSKVVTISIEERGVCYGIADWDDFLVVVFGKYIQIFMKPQLDDIGGLLLALCNISLGLPDAVCEASFHTYRDPLYDNTGGNNTPLYIFARQTCFAISILELKREVMPSLAHSFTLSHRGDIENDPDSNIPEELVHPCAMAAGSTGSTIAWCGGRRSTEGRYEPHSLMLNNVDTFLRNPSVVMKIRVPRKGLPMLHHFPCLDFDDGRGVLAIGTSIGELALVRFSGSRSFVDGCLEDKFPTMHMPSDRNLESVSHQRIPMDLPAYYKWQHSLREKAGFIADKQTNWFSVGCMDAESKDIPLYVIEDLFFRPNQPQVPSLNVQGWSTDWTKFQYFPEWVVPTMRWGCRDNLHEETAVSEARDSTPFLADPIPICFSDSNEDVIFRVGRRLYLLIYFPQDSGMLQSIRKINVELENLSEILLLNITHDKNLSTSVALRGNDLASELMRGKISLFDSMVRHLEKHGMLDERSRPEEWSAEHWKHIFQIRNDIVRRNAPGLDEDGF